MEDSFFEKDLSLRSDLEYNNYGQDEFFNQQIIENVYLRNQINQCLYGIMESLKPFLIYSIWGSLSQRIVYFLTGNWIF